MRATWLLARGAEEEGRKVGRGFVAVKVGKKRVTRSGAKIKHFQNSLSLLAHCARSQLASALAMPQAPQAESDEREPDTARANSGDDASTTSSNSTSPSTFTIPPVGATAAGVAVAAAACALAAGGHWRATASTLAEEGIDAVTRRKALPTAVRRLSFSFVLFLLCCLLQRVSGFLSLSRVLPLTFFNFAYTHSTGPRPGRRHSGLRRRDCPRRRGGERFGFLPTAGGAGLCRYAGGRGGRG